MFRPECLGHRETLPLKTLKIDFEQTPEVGVKIRLFIPKADDLEWNKMKRLCVNLVDFAKIGDKFRKDRKTERQKDRHLSFIKRDGNFFHHQNRTHIR